MARTTNGSSQYLYVDTGLGLAGNDPLWVAFWLWVNSTATSYGIFNIGISGSSNHFRRITSGSGVILAGSGGAGTSATASAALAGANQWQLIIAEWASTTSRTISVNNGTPGTNTTSINVVTAPSQIRLAATLNLSAYMAGRMAWLAAFSGVPTADQKAALAAGAHPVIVSPTTLLDAWDIVGVGSTETSWRGNPLTLVNSPTQSESPRIYLPRGRSMVVVPSASSSYSLSADPGSYTLTGSDAATRAHRLVSGAAGSYAMTGADASLRVGHVLVTDAGVYALTGSDATLAQPARVLSGDPGTYALTGSDATFLRGFVITCDTGIYDLTGADADLLRTGVVELTADPGVYAVTGEAALLRLHRILTADPGAYSITGADALLHVGRALSAGAGAYALTGSAATLQKVGAMAMDADAGAYSLSGVAAALQHHHVLVAQPGTYALTGADLDALRALVLSADVGAYALTGATASLPFSGALHFTNPRRTIRVPARLALRVPPRRSLRS